MKPVTVSTTAAAFAALLFSGPAACRKSESHSQGPPPPGKAVEGKTHILAAGAEALQAEAPINAIHQHVCGFHFYNGNMDRQLRAHHYCSHLNDEFLQCVIYDSDKKDAKLIGIEYIISEKTFKTLPGDEKKYWHSHKYEVLSGQLIAPGVPEVAEKEVMKKLVSTYGKTWHTWQVDRGDALPLGTPKLMMGFTEDGQGKEALVLERDRLLGTDTSAKKASRAGLAPPAVQPGADAWRHGNTFQIPD
ncbi:MAG: OBAP family protein [Verrucomicrobiota bacterium]